MGTRSLEIVRFRRRYYIRYHHYDGYFEGVGAQIVASIPSDPEEYQNWLESKRAEYAARERELENMYETCRSLKLGPSRFGEFCTPPSEFPRLDCFGAEYFYIINLDEQVLTMNFGIHWKLGNIPRQDSLWLRAIEDSIYLDVPTISLDLCPEEHMASPALELPAKNQEIDYPFHTVIPKMDIKTPRKTFLTRVLAEVLVTYMDEILRFAREWTPESFPFRELAFALASIASGQAKFDSLPTQRAGDSVPLREFGSMAHLPGEPPGAAPADIMYWHEGVLVSLALVIDGEAITKAVTWGIEQGHTHFQLVVMSLFKVAFAEVSSSRRTKSPSIKVIRKAVDLSPLRVDYCLSTHPRERPHLKPGMEFQHRHGERIMRTNCTGTARRLRHMFPGLAALVNFFDVAADRRAASKSAGRFPPELYGRILDFVDYDTWMACSVVSHEFRSSSLLKHRLNDQMRIVAGPFVRLHRRHRERLLSFNFENLQTGDILPMVQVPRGLRFQRYRTKENDWMPFIGSAWKVAMVDVVVQFEPAEDVPVEADSDDGTARKHQWW